MTDYTELKRAASEAKNWGGEVGEGRWYTAECFKRPYFSIPDAEFIAACEPGAVLSLIAENKQLRESPHMRAIRSLRGDCADLIVERDQLKAENAGLRTGYEAYEQVNAELKAEVEGLRKDSDKWKIVQRAGDQLLADEGRAAIWSACSRILISVASELNSGRSVVTEEGVTSGGVEIGDWRVTVERIDAALGQGEQS